MKNATSQGAVQATLSNAREALGSSFWFVPAVLMALAALLAYAAVWFDESPFAGHVGALGFLITTDIEGARVLVSAIASSMIGVAGVVFSITVVVLSVASGQLGHRLLRSFMRQNTTQVSLGMFTATFLYCLLLLVRLQTSADGGFSPHLSVSVAVLFALVCLGILVFYIHHVAVFIQADYVVAEVSRELDATIDSMFPAEDDPDAPKESPVPAAALPPPTYRANARDIPTAHDGHIQSAGYHDLKTLAQNRGVLIVLHVRPGSFVIRGAPLGHVWPGSTADAGLIQAVNDAFTFGARPTPHQDVEFAIRQLVEMGVRALSPGINDPFTAMSCIDSLTAALGKLLRRRFPTPYHLDDDARLRLITRPVTFPDLLDVAFNQLRQNACGVPAVTIRLLDSVTLLAPLARRTEDRSALARHTQMIVDGCIDAVRVEQDRDDILGRRERILELLQDEQGAALARADARA